MNIEITKQSHVFLRSGYSKNIEIKVSGTVKEIDDFYEKVTKLVLPERPSAFKKV